MTDSLRERVKTVLLEALNLDPELRRELLEGQHPAVREEVERLLRLSGEMGDFLATSAVEPQSVREAADLTGSMLESRYNVEALLGIGGFGVVYRAYDTRLGRPVAAKVLHRGVFSEAALRTEIRALASIDHSGVVGVLDAGRTQDGHFFLITRYIEGKTLAELLSEQQNIAPALVHRWGMQLGEALAEAHRRGVLHLDIKPENIMVERPGTAESRAVILDFGIGMLLVGRSVPYHYASVGGENRGLASAAEDWHALSAVLFRAFTGTVFTESAFGQVADPRWRSFFATTLGTKDTPAFHAPEEFLRALAGVTTGFSRKRGLAMVGCLLTLFVLALLILPAKRKALEFPSPVPVTTFPGRERYPCLSPDGARVFFTWARPSGGAPLEAPLYVLKIGQSEPIRLTWRPGLYNRPACSPDGKSLAFLRSFQDGTTALITVPSFGGAETEIARGYYSSLDWVLSGCCLVLAVGDSGDGTKRVKMFDLHRRLWSTLTNPPTDSPGDSDPAVSPDGRMLAFVRHLSHSAAELQVASFDPELRLLTKAWALSGVYQDMRSPQWMPDGRSILFVAGTRANHTLWRVDLNRGRREIRVIEAGDHLNTVATARSARKIVFSRDQDDTNIWRADLRQPGGPVSNRRPVIASTFDDEEQSVSPDGKMLAYVSHRTGKEQMWVSSLDGTNERQLTTIDETDDLQVFWDPKGRGLWLTGNMDGNLCSRFIRLPQGQLSGGHIPYRTVGVSSGGDFLYVLIDREGKRAVYRLAPPARDPEMVMQGAVIRVLESPDGRTVYCGLRDGDILRLPVKGGRPEKVLDGVLRRGFAVGRSGIYFVSSRRPTVVEYFSFVKGTRRELFQMDKSPGFGFDISPDETTVFYTQVDQEGADLMLIDASKTKF